MHGAVVDCLWYPRLVCIALICAAGLSGCATPPAAVPTLEQLTELLELSAEQQEAIRPKLVEIADIVAEYQMLRNELPRRYVGDEEEQAELTARTSRLETEAEAQLREIVAEIEQLLTVEQREKLTTIRLYRLEAAGSARAFASREAKQFMRLKPVTEVTPWLDLSHPPSVASASKEVAEQFTVVFGPPRLPVRISDDGSGFAIASISQETIQFPLLVEATFLDPQVVVAEAPDRPDSTAPRQRSEYWEEVRNSYNLAEVLAFRLRILTWLHRSYLDLDRWIIFLENDTDRQVEPIKASIGPIQVHEAPYAAETEDRGGRRRGLSRVAVAAIEGTFYFPRHDFLGNPFINGNTRLVKLVVLSRTRPSERAEGTWYLRRR